MFLDRAGRAQQGPVHDGAASLFEREPALASRSRRTVAAVVTTRDAVGEARRLAPALRACRAVGDALTVWVLPVGDESSLHGAQAAVRRVLGVESVEVPAPRPASARGPVQREMRHAYRVHEHLKTRAPDLVLSTQTLGTLYFALRARELGVCFQRTRFVVVLDTFELQRRLNERLVTSGPYALIRFHLERAVAQSADVCVAPSQRFVDNAVRTGAAAPGSRFVVLPEVEAVRGVSEAASDRRSGFVIPDAAPLARNIALFATVAKRHPEALRDLQGRVRLHVDTVDRGGTVTALCAAHFAGTEVAWTVGPCNGEVDTGEAVRFVPYCEDFFALGAALAPVLRGAPALIGRGTAVGEPFEAAGVAVEPFPDAMADALAEAAEGGRALRVTAHRADREASWRRLFGNLAPPRPVEVCGAPLVTVCILHFNRPELVRQAVASVLGQSYRRLEILLFDDGSDAPGVVAELEALVDAHAGRIRLLRQDNRYLGAARNGAARAAGGEYVYFLDDDNVLKPGAVETLVRAAQTCGADFIGSFSDIFTGGDMPDPAAVAERRILQAGDDAGFSLFQNAILDGNALCRREAFLDLGGNTEDYGIGKDDQEFFARAIRSGRSAAIVPEALFWARHGMKGLKSLHFNRNAGHFRVLEAYWPAVDSRYRGLLLLLQGMFIERYEAEPRVKARPDGMEASRLAGAGRGHRSETVRRGHVMALAHRGPRPGLGRLEVGILLDLQWLDQARRRSPAPVLELRRNGRALARASVPDDGGAVRFAAGPSPHAAGALYSVHDVFSGELLARVLTPLRQARHVQGAVESRPHPQVRGWVLDPVEPGRSRRVAIHVDGRLAEVVTADGRRNDIARWKGTDGHHGFLWRVPKAVAEGDEVRIEVFDAETGRPLRGSPVRLEGGQVIAGAKPETADRGPCMFPDRAGRAQQGPVDDGAASLFEREPALASRSRRTVAAVVTTRDAVGEARRLAPALRACRAVGDALTVWVLPVGDESSLHGAQAAVRRVLGVESVEVPAPRPATTDGLGQREMRHAYRVHEHLKTRAPDLVLSTQTLGTLYFALRARELGVCFQRTRFVVVLDTFELQRRLNERLVTSGPYALIRFHLERAVAQSADVCVAPSQRFVDNAVRTGAAAPGSRFVVLPEVEAVRGVSEAASDRRSGFVIPDAAPLARNIALFATVAKRHPEALRDLQGRVRLHVDTVDRGGTVTALCAAHFAGTEVAWTVGPCNGEVDTGEAVRFVPYCEDFFALGAALAPVLRGAPALIGRGTAVGEPFEAAGVAVEPFPDAMADALAEAAEGGRALRVTAHRADREISWRRLFGNLAPPRPVEVCGAPLVTVCILHFNRPELVRQAVASVLGQSYRRLEILLFDDGSDAPGVVAELEALVDAHAGRIRLLRQDNRYTGAAHNAAARAAGGEYVYFLDDDNVLKPGAVETLVRAAQTCGADFIGSFSDIFTGGDMPDPAAVAERRILQAGGDAGFSLFRNVILDGNFLCRREAFLGLGGHTEDYGIGKEDQEFFARAIRSGRSAAIVPEALFWARHGTKGIKSLHFDWNAGHFRVLEAYWPAVDSRYRGLLLLLQGMFIERYEAEPRVKARPDGMEASRLAGAGRGHRSETVRRGHVMALAHRGPRPGLGRLEVGILLDSQWLDRARRRSPAPVLELHRNGRVLARASVPDDGGAVRFAAGPSPHAADALYSIHDVFSGELLARVLTPLRQARHVQGAVESRPHPQVRGWVLDPVEPGRSRRVAIHVDGRLAEVVTADGRRNDIARWKGTDGRHGFLWRVPKAVAEGDEVRIEVFDAETGRPLRGSPLRIENDRATVSERRGT